MIECPCHNCDNRVLGCHATCNDKYIPWKALVDEERMLKAGIRNVDRELVDHHVAVREKFRRAHRW